MSLPVLYLTGTTFEQGLQHGRELRERIARNLDVYFDRFEREVRLPREEVLRRARLYGERIRERDPEYWDGIRGIAEGSACDLDAVTALNVRYEILYNQYTRQQLSAGECTSFAVLPEATAGGHLLMGQNWDWIPHVLGAVLHTTGDDGHRTAAFTEAGIFGGKIGLNSAGLGLAINGLLSVQDDWSRLARPFHVRCWEILRSRDLDAAVRVVTGEDRSCSTNFLVARGDRAVDIEAAPERVHLIPPGDGVLTHANHFTDPGGVGLEPPLPRRHLSCRRQERMGRLLHSNRPVGIEDLKAILRDHEGHPNSLCRHPDETLPVEQRSVTVTGAIMDLHDGRLLLTDGQPCGSEFQELCLA